MRKADFKIIFKNVKKRLESTYTPSLTLNKK